MSSYHYHPLSVKYSLHYHNWYNFDAPVLPRLHLYLQLLIAYKYYLNKYSWGEYVPSYIRLEIAKQRGGTQSTFSNVILYKNNNNYLGMITPEQDWNPLKVEIEDSEMDGYN